MGDPTPISPKFNSESRSAKPTSSSVLLSAFVRFRALCAAHLANCPHAGLLCHQKLGEHCHRVRAVCQYRRGGPQRLDENGGQDLRDDGAGAGHLQRVPARVRHDRVSQHPLVLLGWHARQVRKGKHPPFALPSPHPPSLCSPLSFFPWQVQFPQSLLFNSSLLALAN